MRDDHAATPPRAQAGGPPPPPTPPQPLPAGAVGAFAARAGLPLAEVGACLGLERAQLLAFDRSGGPEWLRLALIGLAVARRVPADAFTWLLAAAAPDRPAPAADDHATPSPGAAPPPGGVP